MSEYRLWQSQLLTTNCEQEPVFSISLFQTLKLQSFSFVLDLIFHVMTVLAM